MKKNIKIYLPCHMESFVPKSEILTPIQVGTALSEKRFMNMLHDDEGDNISSKNKMYCELTAQYWVWKNQKSDYVGFFHYRRYLSFSPFELPEDGWGNVEYKKPISEEILKKIGVSDQMMHDIICKYDIIVPKRRKLEDNKTIYRQYNEAFAQYSKDIDRLIDVINEKYPEYYESLREYLNSREAYECNIFIMRNEIFQQYMEWLFDILFEYEEVSDFSSYNEVELRAIAYLGERLFGIWYYHNTKDKKWKTLELQKTLFRDIAPKKEYVTKKESVNIVMSSNDYYVPYLATSIQSIAYNANTKRTYDIFVLNKNITKNNQKMVKDSIDRYANVNVYFVDVSNLSENMNFFVDQHLSIETYYRLFIPELFKDTSKIMYLDCDMVVNNDVALLYDIDLENKCVAAAPDIDLNGWMKNDENIEKYVVDTVGVDEGNTYFQAGVLVLNLDKIRELYTSEELIRIALDRDWKFWDQDVLNKALDGRVKYISQKWNVVMNWTTPDASRMTNIKAARYELYHEYMESRKEPYVVHYAGFQKPWDNPECDMASYFWFYARMTNYYEIIVLRMIRHEIREMQCLTSNYAYDDTKIWEKLDIHAEAINRHESVINRHEEVVNRHEEVVNRHEEVVNRHEEVVNRHEEVVNRHENSINHQWEIQKWHEERIKSLEQNK